MKKSPRRTARKTKANICIPLDYFNMGLTLRELAVLVAVDLTASKGSCEETNRQLAIDCSGRTVSRTLKGLEAKGIIETRRRGKQREIRRLR